MAQFMGHEYVAAWGNGRLGTEAGILGVYATPEEAEERVADFLREYQDNPAVGAWVRLMEAAADAQ